MKKIIVTILIIIIIGLAGCTQTDTNTSEKTLPDPMIEKVAQLEQDVITYKQQINDISSKSTDLEKQNKTLELANKQSQIMSNQLLIKAITVMTLIKNKDMTQLATHIHPTAGVRFSPYGHINVQNDLVFSATQLQGLLASTQVYTWGSYDGSGKPINLTFTNYYNEFVYDEDYVNPHMLGNNHVIGTGNAINNIGQAYSDCSFVEFHFTGFNAQYAGLDWSSLRLVFKDISGTWYLVGIIHDQWTI